MYVSWVDVQERRQGAGEVYSLLFIFLSGPSSLLEVT
jgi:hypothetical protein